jgi:hypothetical protein
MGIRSTLDVALEDMEKEMSKVEREEQQYQKKKTIEE